MRRRVPGRRQFLHGIAFGAAAVVAALPAVIGLADNPSFSQSVPVAVPTQVAAAYVQDHRRSAAPRVTQTPSATPTAFVPEPVAVPAPVVPPAPVAASTAHSGDHGDHDNDDDHGGRGR